MKKHLFNLLFFVFTAASSFAVAPIWYNCDFMAHGTVIDGNGFYWAHGFTSSWFIKLVNTGEGYETAVKTTNAFRRKVAEAEQVIEIVPDERAILLSYNPQTNSQHYSLVKVKEGGLQITYSTALRQILDFEKSKRKF